jgi:lipopolysaccharide/colanic/teichoic acid biosynthesis glycosyltransferase
MATPLVEHIATEPNSSAQPESPAKILRFRPRFSRTREFASHLKLSIPTSIETSVPEPIAVPLQEAYTSSNTRPTAESDAPTRALNIVVAVFGLILLAPLLVLIALAVKLTSKGGVFYKQTRIGLDRRWNEKPSHEDSRLIDFGGRPFTMYKFRTMVDAAEQDAKEVWATQEDKRVTTVGKILRVTRLDEVPQLWNVLRGEMNIVGPRPERPTIFAELRVAIPHYHLRQRVRPGITGWAQINQAYDTCLDDVRRKIEYDLEYVRTRSVAQDIKIMARTVPVMVSCKLGW